MKAQKGRGTRLFFFVYLLCGVSCEWLAQCFEIAIMVFFPAVVCVAKDVLQKGHKQTKTTREQGDDVGCWGSRMKDGGRPGCHTEN